jgi:long-chain acyl-CoA synthetase
MTASSDATMPQILRRRAEEDGDALALREKDRGLWRRTTWREYFETVRIVAIGLKALGFGAMDRLAIASENTPEWLYADLGAQSLGGAGLGIYPTNPWPELHYILRHSRAKIVVCGDQEQTDKVIEARRKEGGLPDLEAIVCVDMKGMRGYSERGLLSFEALLELGRKREADLGPEVDAALANGMPDDVAIIVYTSGTTGMPKGAMLSHRNMLFAADEVAAIYGLDRNRYSVLCYLPLCHVAERGFSTVLQLATGCPVSFAESIDTVLEDLREIAPKGFLGVPRIWEKMRETVHRRSLEATSFQRRALEWSLNLGRPIALRRLANGGRLASAFDRARFVVLWLICFRSLQRFLGLDQVRNGFCGGAAISTEVLLFFWTLGLPVYQIYGMTETAGVCFGQRPGATRLGCAGLAIEGAEWRRAEDGELLVRAPSIFKGYLFDDEATARTIKEGWLHTGDVIEEEGEEIRIVDRKKDILITSGGKNITPSLIENALKDSPYIREAILIGEGRNFLSALIQIDLDTTGKWAQARRIAYTNYRSLAANDQVRDLIDGEVRRVNERFARVENIRKFAILAKELDHDDGELTATMKVRRRTIEKMFHEEIASLYGSAA